MTKYKVNGISATELVLRDRALCERNGLEYDLRDRDIGPLARYWDARRGIDPKAVDRFLVARWIHWTPNRPSK